MAISENAPNLEATSFGPNQKQVGLWGLAFERLRKNRISLIAAIALGSILVFSTLAGTVDAVARYRPSEQQFVEILTGPTSSHWLGTDNLGRDTWSRVWAGTRISLKIGIGTQIVVLAIGIAVGAGAALGGKLTDNVLMRFTDLMYAFPDLLAIILMRAVLSQRDWPIIGTGDPQIPGMPGSLLQVVLAISFVSWVTLARLVRGQMLALKDAEYILAAESMGASSRRIVFSHMLPNTLGPVIVAVTFGVPTAIFAEAFLGFIGFGLPPPTASLGTLVAEGQSFVRVNQWMVLVPSAAIAILMLCFTFLGDGLRDALDPRTRR